MVPIFWVTLYMDVDWITVKGSVKVMASMHDW